MQFWQSLNETWAGLGQLLNNPIKRNEISIQVDKEVADWASSWRACDRERFNKILKAYSN
jgi:hypothetical protein